MAKKPRKRTANPAAASAGAPQASDETPVDYMLRVMRDPKADKKRRDIMAKSATPYVHRKPAPKKKRGGAEATLKKRLEIPMGFVRVLDAASLGADPDTLSLAPGQSDDSCAPVTAARLAASVAANYAIARENAEQLNALQAWNRTQAASAAGH